jgi:hypothetical protein
MGTQKSLCDFLAGLSKLVHRIDTEFLREDGGDHEHGQKGKQYFFHSGFLVR